ncbi:MAG: hypothetical protein ACOH2M_11510 [Cypionkella sp.]
MSDSKSDSKRKSENPDLKDVEPGSDADETPVAEPGKTPPSPDGAPK